MVKTKFLFTESKLSEVTGISRTDLVKLRKENLVKGKDWRLAKKGKGRPVELTEEVIQKILQAFEIKDADLSSARIHSSKTAATSPDAVNSAHDIVPRQPEQLVLMTVTFIPSNKRLVRARNGSEQEEWVIVPSNLVWAIGDHLRAKASRHVGYMELVGTAPRWRGDKLYRHEFV